MSASKCHPTPPSALSSPLTVTKSHTTSASCIGHIHSPSIVVPSCNISSPTTPSSNISPSSTTSLQSSSSSLRKTLLLSVGQRDFHDIDTNPGAKKTSIDMLLDNLDHSHQVYYNDLCLPSPCSPNQTAFSLPSPTSPHPTASCLPSSPTSSYQGSSYHLPSPSCQVNTGFNYFQFPAPPSLGNDDDVKPSYTSDNTGVFKAPSSYPVDGTIRSPSDQTDGCLIKEEPWTVPAFDISPSPSSHPPPPVANFPTSSRSSVSPMLLSPAVSNLNTPRVSLSSLQSDFSSKLRSNHSSLQCSPHTSPLGFLDPAASGLGGFGHSLAGLHDIAAPSTMETSPAQSAGCMTPPRSGYSSPLQDSLNCHQAQQHLPPPPPPTAPPTYEQTIQNYQISLGGCQYLPPPYSYAFPGSTDPSLGTPFTPEPDSLVSEPPDTPDSSIKEEPSEEVVDDPVTTCR